MHRIGRKKKAIEHPTTRCNGILCHQETLHALLKMHGCLLRCGICTTTKISKSIIRPLSLIQLDKISLMIIFTLQITINSSIFLINFKK